MPQLYLFVNEQGFPLITDVTGNGQSFVAFLFFTGEKSAQLHRDQSTLEARWQMTSSESADEFIEICDRESSEYDVFMFDPQAVEGTELHPATADEVKIIIEDHVGANEWNTEQYY